MACCKVPIKINGFSGGCASIMDTTAVGGVTQRLTDINVTTFVVSGNPIKDLAYLGLKCVNIACPPILVIADTLSDLAAFLDAQQAAIINTDVTLGALTAVTNGSLLIQNGVARLIAGCGCCSS